MAENVRFAIEKEEKIQDEILLKDKDFVVDLVSARLPPKRLRMSHAYSRRKVPCLLSP